MLRSSAIRWFYAAAVIVAGWCGAVGAAPSVFTLPSAAKYCAISPKGAVAASDGSETVSLYTAPGAGKADVSATVKLGGRVIALASVELKNDPAFVVLSAGKDSLYVLDGISLKILTTVSLSEPGLSMGVTSYSPAPYVYVAHGPVKPTVPLPDLDSPGSPVYPIPVEDLKSNIERINLITGASEGRLEGIDATLGNITVSADGAYLYAMARTPASGMRVLRLPAGHGVRAEPVAGRKEGDGSFLVDTTGTYVAAGRKLFNSVGEPVKDDPGVAIAAFIPDRPLAVSLQQGQAVFYSLNSLKKVGSMPLSPPTPGAATRGRGPAGGTVRDEPVVLADPTHDAILLMDGTHVTVLPRADAKLPAEPFPFVRVGGSQNVFAYWEVRLPLIKMEAASSIALVKGPAGMELTKDMLHWNPRNQDFGPAKVTLKITSGKVEQTRDLNLSVTRFSVPLPFEPVEFKLLPGGKEAILIAGCGEREYGNRLVSVVHREKPRIALVEIPSGKVIADRAVDGFRDICFDDQRIYLGGSKTRDGIRVLSLKDLSDAANFTASVSVDTGMYSTGTRLFLSSEYTIPDFKKIDYPFNTSYSTGTSNLRDPEPGPDGTSHRGVFYDGTLTKPQLMFSASSAFRQEEANGILPPYPIDYWGNALDLLCARPGAAYKRPGGSNIQPVVSPASPAFLTACSLVDAKNKGGPAPVPGASLLRQVSVHDLVTGKVAGTIPLYYSGTPQGYFNDELPMAAVPGFAAVSGRDCLYPIYKEELEELNLPVPIYFEPHQSVIEAAKVAPVKLSYTVHGGKPPYVFSLDHLQAGQSIDPKTGDVTLDVGAAKPKVIEWLVWQIGREKRSDPAKIVFERCRLAYRSQFFKEPPQGVPFAVNIRVKATDSAGEAAVLSHYVLFSLNEEEVLKQVVPNSPGTAPSIQ